MEESYNHFIIVDAKIEGLGTLATGISGFSIGPFLLSFLMGSLAAKLLWLFIYLIR